VLNLILNSNDAMCAADEACSELVIRSQEVSLARWRFSVRDPVNGLSATDAERIFDPFFSRRQTVSAWTLDQPVIVEGARR